MQRTECAVERTVELDGSTPSGFIRNLKALPVPAEAVQISSSVVTQANKPVVLLRSPQTGYQTEPIDTILLHRHPAVAPVPNPPSKFDSAKSRHGLRSPAPLSGTRQPDGQGSQRVFKTSCQSAAFCGEVQSRGSVPEK